MGNGEKALFLIPHSPFPAYHYLLPTHHSPFPTLPLLSSLAFARAAA
jgi:hypothetical protein